MALTADPNITLDAICNKLEIILDYSQIKLNKALAEKIKIVSGNSYSYKSLARARDGNIEPYKKFRLNNYKALFDYIDEVCKEKNRAFVNLFHEWFPQLNNYNDREIKHIVVLSLDAAIGIFHESGEIFADIAHAKDFLKDCLGKRNKVIASICMAFHSGRGWQENEAQWNLIKELSSKNIKLQIVVNHQDAIEKIAESMSDSQREETKQGFNKIIELWRNNIEKDHLTNVEFRISDYPILRKIYIVNYYDKSTDALVRHYAYNYNTNYDLGNIHITDNDPYLKIFKEEFDYLWEKATPATEWITSEKQGNIFLSPGTYIGVHFSHTSFPILSTLKIGNANDIYLKIEITHDTPQYAYSGHVKTTNRTIYMTLFDEKQLEQVNISLYKPVHDRGRLLGIMTAFSPQGVPVAFKFACIKASRFHEIHLPRLFEILSRENLIVFETDDINSFYSDKMLICSSEISETEDMDFDDLDI